MHAQRQQFYLNHRAPETVHVVIGDTLNRMATEISINDPAFRLWDKGQLVVVIIRGGKDDTIFV